jgi:hypothetical protein|tara:strand:+ start:437 stop:610 length:174 start_codon:yes stop_codon:yes gene_type:complete
VKIIKKIILNILLAAVLLFFAFIFFWGSSDCSPTMPFPCPDNWDPINECIKGQDCPD